MVSIFLINCLFWSVCVLLCEYFGLGMVSYVVFMEIIGIDCRWVWINIEGMICNGVDNFFGYLLIKGIDGNEGYEFIVVMIDEEWIVVIEYLKMF